MSIKEVQLKKKNLESSIRKMLEDFQKETEVRVNSVSVDRRYGYSGDENYISFVKIDVSL